MKRKIAVASIAALLIGGGTATAVAAAGDDSGSGPEPKAAAAQQADHDDDGRYDDRDDDGKDDDARDDRDGRDDDGKDDVDQDDKAEMKALQNAEVSASDAAAAALKAVPGDVDSVEFDDEDSHGPAAWDVDVLGQDGKWHSVTIDAANAKVLEKSVDNDD